MRSDRPHKRCCAEYQDKRFTNTGVVVCEVVVDQLTVADSLFDGVVIRVHKITTYVLFKEQSLLRLFKFRSAPTIRPGSRVYHNSVAVVYVQGLTVGTGYPVGLLRAACLRLFDLWRLAFVWFPGSFFRDCSLWLYTITHRPICQ